MESNRTRVPAGRRLTLRLLWINLLLALVLGAAAAGLFRALAPTPPGVDAEAALEATAAELSRALEPARTLADALVALAWTHWTSTVDLRDTATAFVDAAARPQAVVAVGLWPAPRFQPRPHGQSPLLWTRGDSGRLQLHDDAQRYAPDGELWFNAALIHTGSGCLWSGRHEEPATRRPVVTCAAPIVAPGTTDVLGVVTVHVDTGALQPVLNERPDGQYAVILDRDNNVVAVPSDWPASLQTGNLAGVAQYKSELGSLAVELHNRREQAAQLPADSSAAILAGTLGRLSVGSDATSRQRMAAHLARTVGESPPGFVELPSSPHSTGAARAGTVRMPEADMLVILALAGNPRIYGLHAREWVALAATAGVLLIGLLLSYTVVRAGILGPLNEVLVRLASRPDEPLTVHGQNELSVLQTLINAQQEQARKLRSELLAVRAGIAPAEPAGQGDTRIGGPKAMAQILNSFEDAIVVTDAAGKIEFMNAAAESLSGWPLTQARTRHFDEVLIVNDQHGQKHIKDLPGACLRHTDRPRHALAAVFRTRSGHNLPISVRIVPVRSGKTPVGVVISLHDRRTEAGDDARDREQFPRDPLTHCLTRPAFDSDLAIKVDGVRMGAGDPFCVAFLDVDALQRINDDVGSAAGDELLRQVAHLISTDMGPDSTVYRLHGDKFAVIMDASDSTEAQVTAELLRADVQSWGFKWQDTRFESTVTVALVPVDASVSRAVDVIRGGFDACHRAKLEGRNRVVSAKPTAQPAAAAMPSKDWLSEIKRGLAEDRFHLSTFRAQSLQRGADDGDTYETVLQLEDDEGFWANAREFMPAAEAADLGMQLDQWVVQRIFERIGADQSLQQSLGMCIIPLSNNTLQSSGFLDVLMEALRDYKVPPQKICFQASQHSIQERLATARNLLTAIQKIGCRVCISEIATNPSGFNLLKELPAEFVKIDPALTSRAAADPVERLVVESVHKIAHTLEMRTIAEHIESSDTLRLLQGIGIDFAIGNAVARANPMLFGATV